MSLIYGYDDNNSDGVIKTYDTRMTFTKYNDRKIIKDFDYVALNEYSSDMVLSIKDIFTVPKACSITLELPPPNNNPTVKPSKPIDINITIQYIEFSTRNYGS